MKIFNVLLLLAAVPAAASDIPGVWRIQGSVGGQNVTSVCNLKQQGEKVTGSCAMDGEQPVDVVGSVKADKVMLQYGIDDGGTNIIISFNGTLNSPSEMKGEVFVDPYEMQGTFTARQGAVVAVEAVAASVPVAAQAPVPEPPAALDPGKNATFTLCRTHI